MKITAKLLVVLTLSGLVFTSCKEQKKRPTQPIDPMETGVRSNEKPKVSTPYMTITHKDFLGIHPGDFLSDHKSHVKPGKINSDRGQLHVYYIYNGVNDVLGYIIADYDDPKSVGTIHLTHTNIKTDQGVSVGMTLEDLRDKVDNVEVVQSFGTGGRMAKSGKMHYQLDEAGKITELVLSRI